MTIVRKIRNLLFRKKRDQTKTQQLDVLFNNWKLTYPPDLRDGFHKDGIIHEPQFDREQQRVLFTLLEPNSSDGMYDRFYGADLRWVFRECRLGKSINKNLAIWTQIVLDECDRLEIPSPEVAERHLCRVSIMNLKKFSGSGTADHQGIQAAAWNDREFINQEIAIINPTVIVVARKANRLLASIVRNEPLLKIGESTPWTHRGITVVPFYHPSCRKSYQSLHDEFKKVWASRLE